MFTEPKKNTDKKDTGPGYRADIMVTFSDLLFGITLGRVDKLNTFYGKKMHLLDVSKHKDRFSLAGYLTLKFRNAVYQQPGEMAYCIKDIDELEEICGSMEEHDVFDPKLVEKISAMVKEAKQDDQKTPRKAQLKKQWDGVKILNQGREIVRHDPVISETKETPKTVGLK